MLRIVLPVLSISYVHAAIRLFSWSMELSVFAGCVMLRLESWSSLCASFTFFSMCHARGAKRLENRVYLVPGITWYMYQVLVCNNTK